MESERGKTIDYGIQTIKYQIQSNNTQPRRKPNTKYQIRIIWSITEYNRGTTELNKTEYQIQLNNPSVYNYL